jgi:hypothetical protein
VKTRTQLLTLAAIASFLAATLTTQAVPQLRISDGVNPAVTITDNGAGDTSPLAGHVNYLNGSFFGWNILVSSGVTKPIVGSAVSPVLDLSWQAIRGAGASPTLSISFSENDFNLTAPRSFEVAAGGTLGNVGSPSVNVRSWYDLGNTTLAETTLLTSHLFSGQGGYSGSDNGGPVPADPSVAFTVRIDVSLALGGIASGDVDLTSAAVPETGSTFAFFATALCGLGIFAVRCRKVRAS